MPRHESFEKIYQQFIKRYGKEQGERLYYAWLNSFDPPLDDTKPMPEHLPPKKKGETLEAVFPPAILQLVEKPEGRVYKVTALHVGRTGRKGLRDEEGLPRLRHYSEDELMRAARTLVMKPVNLNHLYHPENAETNRVLWAEYDEKQKAVIALVQVSDQKINELYDQGEIIGASVEYVPLEMKIVDGVKPSGILFEGLALVSKEFQPGDSETSVELIADLISPAGETRSAGEAAEKVEKEVSEMSEKKEVEQPKQPENVQEAEWDTAYINDLPDAAFAYIAPGGEKDEEGKTKPRSLRYLPHHNKNVKDGDDNDTVDLDHLRNALARLPQTDLPQEAKEKARAHLLKHAKALLPTYQQEEIVSKAEYESLKAKHEETLKALEEQKKRIEELESKLKEFEKPVKKEAEKAEEAKGVAIVAPVEKPEPKETKAKKIESILSVLPEPDKIPPHVGRGYVLELLKQLREKLEKLE